jgi:hypothetical protein
MDLGNATRLKKLPISSARAKVEDEPDYPRNQLTFSLRLFTLWEYWLALVEQPEKTELEYRVIAVL